MSNEEIVEEPVTQEAVSEQPEVQAEEVEQKMVPLTALEAERRKRQDAEAKAQVYQEFLMKHEAKQEQPEETEDPNALVEKHVLKETTAASERRILETLYQDMNPKAVLEINTYLKPILEKKPWLAQSVDTAQNRYARAYEIVQDYKHLVEAKPQGRSNSQDGQRIIQNANKPRSPAEIGKSARPDGAEYLKSIQGKKEFREYREKVLRGEA
jgi:hypothetical protein